MKESNKLISISGKKRSGKNQVADLINEILIEQGKEPYEQKAFAAKLKKFCSELTGIPLDGWETEEDKDKELGPEWNTFDQYGIKVPMTRRRFMQKFGSDAVNEHLHKDTWVNALFQDYDDSRWCVFDCRQPQEAKAIKDRKGVIIRVQRPETEKADGHASEVGLDDYKGFDFFIINDGTIEQLKDKVRTILFKLRLI